MLEIGDDVVVMSAPGVFKVIAIDGRTLTIESADGVRKQVLEGSVRSVGKQQTN